MYIFTDPAIALCEVVEQVGERRTVLSGDSQELRGQSHGN